LRPLIGYIIVVPDVIIGIVSIEGVVRGHLCYSAVAKHRRLSKSVDSISVDGITKPKKSGVFGGAS